MARGQFGYPGVYNSSPITLSNGEGGALAVNSRGEPLLAIGAYAVDDSNMPATPNIIPIGGEYRATPTTYTDGDAVVLQMDVNGNILATLATAIAGENLTYNRLMTMPMYSYSAVAVADVQIKASSGILHTVTITCNDAAPTAGSIIIYDNTAESGTQVFNHTFTTTPFVPLTVVLDYTMATGIYIGFTTTADVNVSCSFL